MPSLGSVLRELKNHTRSANSEDQRIRKTINVPDGVSGQEIRMLEHIAKYYDFPYMGDSGVILFLRQGGYVRQTFNKDKPWTLTDKGEQAIRLSIKK